MAPHWHFAGLEADSGRESQASLASASPAKGEVLAQEQGSLEAVQSRVEALVAKQREAQQVWSNLVVEQSAQLSELRAFIQDQLETGRRRTLATLAREQQQAPVAAECRPSPFFCSEEDCFGSVLPAVELQHYHTSGMLRPSGHSGSVACVCPDYRDGIVPCVLGLCQCILGWRYFELFMGAVIALNALNIGWSIDKELRGESVLLHHAAETLFLVVFLLEVLMRLVVGGLRALKQPATCFDFCLVVLTALTQVLQPMLEESFLQQVLLLRMMRLLRLSRAVRLVATFRPLWKLAKGLSDCCSTMFSALVLMFIALYIFACIGAEFVTKQLATNEDPEVRELVRMHFSSLPKILLTLVRFTTMDSAQAFYRPLIYRSPWLAVYFLLLFVVVAVAMMNLITALLVEDAITSAKTDQEMKALTLKERIKRLKPALRRLFQTLDVSGDGVIEIKEVAECIQRGVYIPPELQDIVNPARMLDLFEALDADNSGDLSESEFVDGLCCVAVTDMPRETMQVLQLLRSLRQEIRRGLGRGTKAPAFSHAGSRALVASGEEEEQEVQFEI